MPQKIAICAGSFDPPTNGHLNIISRGLNIFDKLIIAVAINMGKAPIFSAEERVAMLKEIYQDEPRIEVDSFSGLLAEYAKAKNVTTIFRGIRNMSDYEYESQMALTNKTLGGLETIFMMTEGKYAHVSSSIIKEVLTYGSSAHGMAHPIVEARLKAKLGKK